MNAKCLHGQTLIPPPSPPSIAALCEWLQSRGSWAWPAVSTFQWPPSVPVNGDEVGGNVLLNNGTLPLATTHLAPASHLIKEKSFF